MRSQSILGLSALAACMAVGAAHADESGARLTVNASTKDNCVATATFSPIVVGDMLDATNGGLKADQVNKKTSTLTGIVVCNSVLATISLDAKPITASTNLPEGASKAGFSNAVEYIATAAIDGYSSLGVTSIVDKTWEDSKETPVGLFLAKNGELTVTLSDSKLAGGGTFLMADESYTGSVTLVVSPMS